MQRPHKTARQNKWKLPAVLLFWGLLIGVWLVAFCFIGMLRALVLAICTSPIVWFCAYFLNIWLTQKQASDKHRRLGQRSLAAAETSVAIVRQDDRDMAELEQLRKMIRNWMLFCTALSTPVFAGLFLLFYIFLPKNLPVAFTISLGIMSLSMIALYEWRTKATAAKYRMLYRQIFVERTLKHRFTRLCIASDGSLTPQAYAFIQSLLVRGKATIRVLNWISAQYQGSQFEQFALYIATAPKRGNSVYFRCRWMVFSFPKQFRSQFFVVQRGGEPPWQTELFQFTQPPYQELRMESEDFNETFLVTALDPHDAFYGLTPQLMEKIQALATKTDGGLMLCFMRNQLCVAVRSDTNAYEPPKSVMRSLNMYEEIGRTQEEIDLITQLVDALHCNNDLFLPTE